MNYDSEQIKRLADWLGSGSINIFGLPFAGKDTQGKKLAEILNAPLIGGGDILRASTDHIRELLATGKLIPTDEYLEVVLPFLGQADFAGKPLILSAVGRWNGEQDSVMQATEKSGHPIKAVVMLNFPEQKVMERWRFARSQQDRGQRDDDAEEVMATRLSEFRQKTLPVIDFYRQKGLLIEVNGDAPRDKVTAEILQSLAQKS